MTKQKFYTVPAENVDETVRSASKRGETVVSVSALGNGSVTIITEVVLDKPKNLLLEELRVKNEV